MKTTKNLLFYPLSIMGLLLIFTISCEKSDTDENNEKAPVLTTAIVIDITQTTATSGGNITSDGGATITAQGVCWSTAQAPTISDSITTDGNGTGSFTSNITGLAANTTYYVRAYATNNAGTAYGNEVNFTTLISTPILTTSATTSTTSTTAISGGNITNDYDSPVIARGVCWSTSPNPLITDNKTTDGSGTGSFTSNITGLAANTTYYVRAYATNIIGTGYGVERVLKTYTGIATDIDGNEYNTVTIGTQVWLVENLKTTKFNNGDDISFVTNHQTWFNSQSWGAKYCWYNNDETSNKNTYGALYNWYAVADYRNICPDGWHVPTDEEWVTLKDYLKNNGYGTDENEEYIAYSMKSTVGWLFNSYFDQANYNRSGFTALPGGTRRNYIGDESFYDIGKGGYWWSSTALDDLNAWCHCLPPAFPNLVRSDNYKMYGHSIRCLQD